jgi:hypothetical protein
MTFHITCTCGQEYHSEPAHVGSYIRCRDCGKILELKDASTLPVLDNSADLPRVTPVRPSVSSHKPSNWTIRRYLPALLAGVLVIAALVFWLVQRNRAASTLTFNPEENGGVRVQETPAEAPSPNYSISPPDAATESAPASGSAATASVPQRVARPRPKDPGVDVVVSVVIPWTCSTALIPRGRYSSARE